MASLSDVSTAVLGLSVEPSRPDWAIAMTPEVEVAVSEASRDGASSWAGFIRYVDASGSHSARRIVCRAIGGYGRAETISAICCEKRSNRSFRVDRIKELICLQSGEVLDPVDHFEKLRLFGVLQVKDQALSDFGRVLSFISRCDGDFHPLESEAISDALSRYVLRMGGDDRTLAVAIENVGKIAPDDADLVGALGRLEHHPDARSLSRLILDSIGRIAAADGNLHSQEVRWIRTVEDYLLGVHDRAA